MTTDPSNPDEDGIGTERRAAAGARHQAVFSLDFPTWQALVESFNITEPVIPDRKDDQGPKVGATGWYQ